LAAGVGILTWAYWPNLQHLYTIWDGEPNYSHGKLVIPIAMYIFWRRLADAEGHWATGRGSWWTWIMLIAVLAGRNILYENNSQWSETATLIPAAACLMLTLGAWPFLKQGWPAVLFLIFMLPLPESIKNTLSLPLQTLATAGSVFVMQLTGLRAIPAGHVINLPDAPVGARTLEVALACNGLSMLMTLAATVTATVILVPLSRLKQVVVLASAIPIALLSNIIRIVATGWCYRLSDVIPVVAPGWLYHLIGGDAKKLAHDLSGWLMMPLAVLLVYLEVRLVSWLTGESEPETDEPDRPILAIIPQASSDKLKPKPPNTDADLSNPGCCYHGELSATTTHPSEPSTGLSTENYQPRKPQSPRKARGTERRPSSSRRSPNPNSATPEGRKAPTGQVTSSSLTTAPSAGANGQEVCTARSPNSTVATDSATPISPHADDT
jgi:exosortase